MSQKLFNYISSELSALPLESDMQQIKDIVLEEHRQSKKLSVAEAMTNTVVGLGLSFLTQIIIYPCLDILVTLNQNIIITSVFFVSSFLRSYLLRRLFNKL